MSFNGELGEEVGMGEGREDRVPQLRDFEVTNPNFVNSGGRDELVPLSRSGDAHDTEPRVNRLGFPNPNCHPNKVMDEGLPE